MDAYFFSRLLLHSDARLSHCTSETYSAGERVFTVAVLQSTRHEKKFPGVLYKITRV